MDADQEGGVARMGKTHAGISSEINDQTKDEIRWRDQQSKDYLARRSLPMGHSSWATWGRRIRVRYSSTLSSMGRGAFSKGSLAEYLRRYRML